MFERALCVALECLKLAEGESIVGRSNHSSVSLELGESASPFIDEGDGLTRERERVRMLLSLVAYDIGYKMMVGTHNTVVVRRMWEVLPHSPCMVNDSTRNTVDA